MVIVVPVDFSPVSIQAARYAVSLSQQFEDVRYIFYHSHYSVTEIETVQADMDAFADSIKAEHPQATFSTEINKKGITDGTRDLVTTFNADLVIMGINGKGKLNQKLIGSNTLIVAESLDVPVLIIPENCTWKPLERLMLAIPYQANLARTLPLAAIEKVVRDFNFKLEIASVHVDQKVADLVVTLTEQQELVDRWAHLQPVYNILDGSNIVNTLLEHAHGQGTSWICTVTKEHSFWELLLKGSVTSDLAYRSDLPILVF